MDNFSFSVDSLSSMLQNTTLPQESGISFAGKALKLDSAKDAEQVIEEINKAPCVEFLNMEGNSLGVAAAEEISKSLIKRKEFKKALWKDMFTGRLKHEIPLALKHLGSSLINAGAKLEVLDLSDNASGPIGVEGFERLLKSPTCYSLRELRLNNMGLGITGGKKLAAALLDLYNNSKNAGETLKLKVFIAGRNRLENEGATALAQVFQAIGTLEEVSMPQNGIYYRGVEALSRAFEKNLNLRLINLNDNTLTAKGALALGAVLPKLEMLQTLDLGDCLLKNKGAEYIANGLSELTQLVSVNLSFNELKLNAGDMILTTLEGKTSLQSVLLEGNQFGSDGVEHLKVKAESMNLPLGSMSDNEEDDDDDDDEEGDDEDDDEEEDLEEESESEHDETDFVEEGDYHEDYVTTESGEDSQGDDNDSKTDLSEHGLVGVSPLRALMQNLSGNQFLTDPKGDNFMKLGPNKAEAILNDIKIKAKSSSDLGEEIMAAIVKVTCLYNEENKILSDEIVRCSNVLCTELTTWAANTTSVIVVNNKLPVHLGFVKDEANNKKRTVPNQQGCLRVLNKSSMYLPKETIDTINFFNKTNINTGGFKT